MRNLKKILALVLAVALIASLAITASAATYTDEAKINTNYAEAVDVLTALGVLRGTGNGEFSPGNYITRAEVATIVYRIMTADVLDAQKGLYTDYNVFKDVSSTDWYAGYVNYAANGELVKGDGTNFYPLSNVTGYQVLAIMLRAIGYGRNGEFEGSGWHVRVAAQAKELGITNGITDGTLGAYVTRELVSSLLFKTIQLETVVYSPALGYYTADVVGADTTCLGYKKFGLNKVAGVVAEGSGYYNNCVTVSGAEALVGSDANVQVIVSDDEVFETGRSAYVWTTEVAGAHYALTGVKYTDTVLATVYDDDWNDWTTAPTATTAAANNFVAATDTAYGVYVNGSRGSLSSIKLGSEVRLIDSNHNGKIDLVLVRDETVYTVGASGVYTWSGMNGFTYVTVPNILTNALSTEVSGYENLVANDVVLAVSPYNGVTYLTKAVSVSGTKTLYNGNIPAYITFAGKNYYASGLNGTSVSDLFNASANTFNVNCTLYLDRGGYAIEAAQVVTPDTYAILLDAGYVPSSAIGSYGQFSYYATLMYLDGTTATVETDKLYRVATSSTGVYDGVVSVSTSFIGHFVKVGTGLNTSKNAYYTALTLCDDFCAEGVSLNKAYPSIGTTGYYANSGTVYLVMNSDGSVSRYIGFANMPSMAGVRTCIIADPNYANLASYVLVNGGSASETSTYYLWAQNAGFSPITTDWDGDGDVELGYTYTGLYNGAERVPISSGTALDFSVGTFYKVVSVNGAITMTPVESVASGVVEYVSNSTIKLRGDVARGYAADGVEVYNAVGAVPVFTSLASVTAGNYVTVVYNADGYVTDIYQTGSNWISDDTELAAAVADGGVLTLVDDISLGSELVIPEGVSVTLNLNGHSIIADEAIRVIGALTITGNGTIDTQDADAYGIKVGSSDKSVPGTLLIKGGTIKASCSAVSVTVGVARIEGGSFEALPADSTGDYRYLLNCYDESYANGDAAIIVTGGTFSNFNPANNLAEGAGTSFVPTDSTVSYDGSVWYTVS